MSPASSGNHHLGACIQQSAEYSKPKGFYINHPIKLSNLGERRMVYDACAGPATGSQTEAAYVASTIGHSTPAEAAAAGDTSDISTKTIGTIN